MSGRVETADLTNETQKLQFLDSLLREINRGNTLDEILRITRERLRDFVPCDRLGVAIYLPERDRLTLFACHSDGPTFLSAGYSGVVKGSSLEPILRHGHPRILNDLQAYLERKPSSDATRLMVKEGMRSSLSLPLLAGGRPVGVMFFSSRRKDSYTADHEDLLRTIAGHVSVIVERTRALEDLRSTKERLENILQNSADAIIAIDADDRIQGWNEGARRIFGYDEAEIVGRPFEILVPEDLQRRGELLDIRRSVLDHGFLLSYETERLTKDGRRIPISLTTTAMRDKQGRYLGRSAIVRDTTDLKRLQREILRNQNLAAVGEMAASIAHEIKNPLAGISGAIQVLRDGMAADDPRRHVIAEVLAQVRRLDDTVRDLLMFSKPWVPDKHVGDLAETVRRICSTAGAQERFAAIRFAFDGRPTVVAVFDPSLVEQVLWNLLLNSADAMPAGGEIRCTFAQQVDGASLVVADTGGGIPPHVMENLFRPFYTTKTRGTGLGLAICKRIMEAHGGSLAIASEPGRGTDVTLVFPSGG